MIDGQQRIRSLVYAFNETDLDDEGDQDESIGTMGQDVQETKRRLWCVNLTRVPILKNYFGRIMCRYKCGALKLAGKTRPQFAECWFT